MKKFLQGVFSVMFSLAVYGMTAFAASKPKFVTGTEKLVSDLTTWLTAGAAAVTVVLLIKVGYQWNIADVEEKVKYKKNFFMTLVIGAAITLASAIVTWLFSYYQ